jgi:hypothetical protein
MPSVVRGSNYYAWRMSAIVSTIVAVAWVIVAAISDSATQWGIAAVCILNALVNSINVRKRSQP